MSFSAFLHGKYRAFQSPRIIWLAFKIILVLISVLLALSWGNHFESEVYTTFLNAQMLLVVDSANETNPGLAGGILPSPFYYWVLVLFARLGWSLSTISLLMSGLGWGLTAVSLVQVGAVINRRSAMILPAILLVFNPIITNTVGTPIPFAIGLMWFTIVCTLQKRWWTQRALLSVLLLSYLEMTVLGFVLLLFATKFVKDWHSSTRVGFVVLGVVIWLTGPLASAHLVVLGLILFGLSLDWLIDLLTKRDLTQLAPKSLRIILPLLIGLTIGLTQASIVWDRYQKRPLARGQLEEQIVNWLDMNSDPTSTIVGSSRLAYLASRKTIMTPDDQTKPNVESIIKDEKPSHVISWRSLTWDNIVRLNWFQLLYQPLVEFESASDGSSPYIVWGRRYFMEDDREIVHIDARVPGQIDILGYQQWPDRIQAGETFRVNLYWQDLANEETAAGGLETTQPFQAVVKLNSVAEDVAFVQQNFPVARNYSEPEDVIKPVLEERYTLSTTADMPVGAYRLNVSFQDLDSRDPWLSIQNDEINRIFEEIPLGFVVIPWQGEMFETDPIEAAFGDQIELLAYRINDPGDQTISAKTAVSLQPGAAIDVILYWQAIRPPDRNYTVFVHLLDGEGQLIAGHDSQPMQNHYPTRLWLPDETVYDVHPLQLPTELAPGNYRLQTGLYRLTTGERLPVWDPQGVEQADRTLILRTIIVADGR